MTLVAIGTGLLFPQYSFTSLGAGGVKTMDADDEKVALIGHVYWNGRPGSAKTFSSSGAQIIWRTATVAFNDSPATTLDVGIQDVAAGAGPHVRPDDSFDVSATLASGTDTINSNAWITTSMETGTKNITHGDLIAIVWHMTNRETDDSIQIASNSAGNNFRARPASNVYLAGAWQATSQDDLPICYLVADDGTLGVIHSYIRPTFWLGATESFADGTNPDERGFRFTAPWDCTVDGFLFSVNDDANVGDFTVTLWQTPTTSASSLFAINVLGEQMAASSNQYNTINFAPVTLAAGTEYGMSVRATSTGTLVMRTNTLNDEALWGILANTSFAKITRDGGSGNFTAESPAVTVPHLGLSIASIDDGDGSGGGGVTPLGNGLHPIGTGVGA